VLAAQYRATAARLKAKIRAAPIGCPPSKPGCSYATSLALHSAAHGINAGIVTAAEVPGLIGRLFNDSVTVCSLSPFNTFYIVQALANTGHYELALATVARCWEPITRLGHGCMWELFSPEWTASMHAGEKAPSRPSFCHPWSSGATAFLTKFALGVAPTKPGFEAVSVTPFASAAWPTIGGTVGVQAGTSLLNVSAKYAAIASGATATISLQTPVPAEVGAAASDANGCALRGLSTGGGSPLKTVRRNRSALSGLYAYTATLPPGAHIVVAHYACAAGRAKAAATAAPALNSTYPFPSARYPVTSIAIDNTTRGGGWKAKGYGREAYALFGFDKGINWPRRRPTECTSPPDLSSTAFLLAAAAG